MNMGQMLLVLLAVMLFSTILITTYSNLYTATDIVYKVMFQMQGLKIADKYLQKIDAELLGKVHTFSEIQNTYSDTTFNTDPINDVVYNVYLNSTQCDSVGNDDPGNTDFQRIDIRIFCTPMGSDTLWIGTANKPIQKVFINMES